MISKFEGAGSVLPPYKADGEEFWFYRDPEKKDTLVVTDAEGADHYFVNPLEVPMGRKYTGIRNEELFAMQFGAHATTRLLVFARSLEDALEEAAGWLADFAPGHLSDLKSEYEDALKEAREELGDGADEEAVQEKAQEIAETDMTYTESGYLTGHEWWGGEARGTLESASLYAARAVTAAEYHEFNLIPDGTKPEDGAFLSTDELLGMFANDDLGLTSQDVERIASAADGETVDVNGGFRVERVS